MISALKTLYRQYTARRVFGRWASSYEEDVAANRYSAAKAVQNALLPYLDRAERITDLGVGTGLIWQGIDIPDEVEITGLDISQAMMEQASAIPELGPLYLCDVGRQEWPIYDGTEDLIVAAGLFEYLTPDMADHVFEEAQRALKAGGRFIFTYIHGVRNETKPWDGRSGRIMSCIHSPAWIIDRNGFILETQTEPFAGSVFTDGQSYDYRLVILRKS